MQLPFTILHQEASDWLLIFSGYGQEAKAWGNLAARCKRHFNVMVIGLPAEPLDKAIEKSAFKDAILPIMQEYHMGKVVALSYSMGSRFNLCLAEELPGHIRAMILMAPDGILRFTWNRIATTTAAGHWLFRQFVYREGFYLALIKILYKVNILTKSLYAFSKWNMRDQSTRVKVYQTWMMMRNMQPDLQVVNEQRERCGFPLIAFFGRQDTVIRPGAAKRLQRKVPGAKIILLDKGHHLMEDEMYDILLFEMKNLRLIP